MDLHLNGKRVLITGGSRGIGLAAAESFAEEGCHVHLAARDKSELEEAADRIRGQFGIKVVIHVVDLSLTSDVQRLANEAGEIDILINNAGDIPVGSIVNVSDTLWRKSWDLKVFGYINLTRLIYARMKARGAGVIINDIGASGERPDFDYVVGSSANAALMALTKALGGRSLEDGVRVVGVIQVLWRPIELFRS
ncbi:3-oxoacyl-[acyl-carrier protein] reductase [Acidisarcina polymorpha]|uniref:3-oxoacyl-[acyl-carrier protein] reductase n=1 Tax=Acidisarcina polymorpha TaxID=2211140 RepID=A0A2Z5FZA1_9BACT|nr:short-chain dehydrogenase/reductase [Acidisarcina polymorpha]AXC12191.1 3-oxoacyl-[acyl-carrier protein] reductase [Acidisarcina polymorpha]